MKNLWKNRNFKPMLLKEIDKPFSSKEYLFELKYDGIRACVFVNPKEIQILSRNNVDMTDLFPELDSIRSLISKNVIFDGEIISIEKGTPSFAKIQNRLHMNNRKNIEIESKTDPVVFIAFDILYENKNLVDQILIKRKEILSKYEDTNVFVKSKTFGSDGIKLFKEVKKKNLEGIIAKNKNSLYHIDKRTDDFIKIKNIKSADFFIGGYKENLNNTLSVAIGKYKKNDFIYIGKVLLAKSTELGKKVLKSSRSKNIFKTEPKEDFVFIRPKIKCEIEYLERTSSGNLRHARIKGEKDE